MYGKKKMQKGGKISKEMREDYTSMPEMDMEVINSANRTSKMEAEADKKLMEVLSDKESREMNKTSKKMSGGKVTYRKAGGKVSSGYKCSHNRLY